MPSVQRVQASAEPQPDQASANDAQRMADARARLERIADAVAEGLQKRVEADKDANMLVFRTIDTSTGKVVRQFPDDLILKLRSFAREMQRAQDEADAKSRDGAAGQNAPGAHVMKSA